MSERIEPRNDFKQMREELVNLLTDAQRKQMSELENYTIDDSERFHHIMENASIQQLWRLYRQTQLGTRFNYCPCNPEDHIAITFAGMYVGIEPDGYMHS